MYDSFEKLMFWNSRIGRYTQCKLWLAWLIIQNLICDIRLFHQGFLKTPFHISKNTFRMIPLKDNDFQPIYFLFFVNPEGLFLLKEK